MSNQQYYGGGPQQYQQYQQHQQPYPPPQAYGQPVSSMMQQFDGNTDNGN
jgi:hypothetical protein